MDLDDFVPSGNGQPPTAPAQGTPPPAWQETGVDLHEYVRILAKRRWAILLTFVGVVASAAAYVYSQPRVYRATAKVQVVQIVPPVVVSAQSGGTPQVSLSTQAKFIRSSITARKACALSDATDASKLTPEEIHRTLSVVIEEPDILSIVVEHTDPERAARIANAVQDAYIDQNTALARAEATSAKRFLESQMEVVKRDAQRTEALIREFKKRKGIRDVEAPALGGLERASRGFSTAEAQMDVRVAEVELDGLRRRLAAEAPTRKVKRVVEDPVTEGLRQALVQNEVDLARAATRYEETHPRVLALKDEVARLEALVKERAAKTAPVEIEEANPVYEALVERVREQEIRVEACRARARAIAEAAPGTGAARPAPQPQAYLELVALERTREISEKAYVQLLEQLQQVRLNEAQQQGTARKVDEASVPSRPIRPNPGRTLVLAVIVGLLAGLSLALVLEYADTNVHDPDQLMLRTGISSLGFVPAAREQGVALKIAARSPRSPITEAFRSIRSNLKFAHLDAPCRTIEVTSAGAGEGKSFTATNLAIVFAQSGARTLLVDGDLRRPTLHRAFGLQRSPGLTDVLTGEASIADAIQPTDVENLMLMSSGTLPPNPAELLDSQRMARVTEELKAEADIIVFDTPPALVVTDAVVLSPRVDAVILVVQQGAVSSRALAEIRRMVNQARGKIVGAVFNKVKVGAGGYYYYRYYRYYYYYGDRDKRRKGEPAGALPDEEMYRPDEV